MYVVWTYTWMNPYIKGMHNRIDSWQEGRAEDGFKLTAKEKWRRQSLLLEASGLLCRRAEEGGGGNRLRPVVRGSRREWHQ